MTDITQILNAVQSGEPRAAERLLPLVYEELLKLSTSARCRAAGRVQRNQHEN